MTARIRPFASRHFAAIALVAAMMTGAPASAATVVSSYKGNGAYAWLSAYQGQCHWMWLSVARDDSTQGRSTYVWYYIYDMCTGEWSYGGGKVPNGSFKISGNKSQLTFDPVVTPGFETYGHIGRIDVTWTTDRSIRSLWDGRHEIVTPTQRYRSRGKSDSFAASGRGSLLGLAVETNSASVGKHRGMYVEVIR